MSSTTMCQSLPSPVTMQAFFKLPSFDSPMEKQCYYVSIHVKILVSLQHPLVVFSYVMSTEKLVLRLFIPLMRMMCLHFYTGNQDPTSLIHPQAKLHRINSSYVRQLSERMLISHHNIKLLKCIGQGRCFRLMHMTLCCSNYCTW